VRIALAVDPEIPVPPPHYGGIERIVDALAHGLAERGHEVTLLAHGGSTCPVPRIGWPGQSSASQVDTLRNAATLARHVARGRFDIVNSFSRLAYLGPILPLPIPKLMSYHREISPRTTRLAHAMARGTLEFSAIGQHLIDRQPLAGTWHLVPNGVPLGTYACRTAVSDEAPLVFLGRIEAIKGAHVAIAVAQHTGRRLVLAGNVPPEHRAWFGTSVAPHLDGDRIRYVGPVDDGQKSDLLGSAWALLMPVSWEEPFGLVMIEAMACGTPVIGFRRGGVPEVVTDGETGFVVDTAAEMAAAVGRIPGISRAACRARVERLYSERALTERCLAVYSEVIARVRGKAAAIAASRPQRAG
jgi:glycosyltransferase involved in cell wall biosynthesis